MSNVPSTLSNSTNRGPSDYAMPYNISIPGQVSEWELRAIEALAALVPVGGTIVEIGSLFGRSSWAWAKSADPSVTVCCIDPWEGNEGIRPMEQAYGISFGIDQFLANVANCPNVQALQGYSPEDFQTWDRPIDLFFEDSVHADPILSANMAFWSSHLRPTGVACGHDYRPRFPDVVAGVRALADRLGRELIVVEYLWCLLPQDDAHPLVASVRLDLRNLAAESEAALASDPWRCSFEVIEPPARLTCGVAPQLTVIACNDSRSPWRDDSGADAHAAVELTIVADAQARVVQLLTLPGPLKPDQPQRVTLRAGFSPSSAGLLVMSAQLVLLDAEAEVTRRMGRPRRWEAACSAAEDGARLPRALRAIRGQEGEDFEAATAADVHAAYRLFLGRAAGSFEEVERHLAAAPTIAALAARFMASPEFLGRQVGRHSAVLGTEASATVLRDAPDGIPERSESG
ncbi:class I SAM-dependent methyltransferase [Pseudoxanthobacter sp. M-2]|uniref:class I SAM-dependent methyltransferase n=1 Tax=Pseudoxanthobacter sp. M-2 TaxID=3078754 RepID=UPI0038FC43A7